MTLTFDLDLEFDLWPWRFGEIHFFRNYSFCLKSRDVKTWRRTSNGWPHTKAPFHKERFATNQKSLSLPVQKLWPIYYVIFNDYFEVLWRKNMTSYVKSACLFQKRNSIRNVLQPTRNLCYFRYKSYGQLCDFHKSGDLDLDFYPISKKKNLGRFWTRIHHMSKNQDDRSSGVACTSRTDGQQTDRQTDGRTDGRTDGQIGIRKAPLPFGWRS